MAAKDESKIDYINPKIPDVPARHYPGTFSDELVPDTLDLAERARLAIHGMTGPTDPDADYEVYWRAHFKYNPPIMIHTNSDTGIRSKFMIAMPLMRLMTGSEEDAHVEQRWLEVTLHEQGPDGLLATPFVGRPWGRIKQADTSHGLSAMEKSQKHAIETQHNGFAVALATHYGQVSDRQFWESFARRIVDGYERIVVRRGDEAYMAKTYYDVGEAADRNATPPMCLSASWVSWSALGLNRCWRLFGYEPARDLAGSFLRFMARSSGYFAPDGGFLLDTPDAGPGHDRYGVTHFHGHTLTVLHALDHALMTGDQELLDFARRAYEKAVSYGEPMLGWYPERVTGPCYPQACELCCTADMIMIPVLFAAAGLDDSAWDVVDCALRNQFAECQLRHSDWIYRLGTGEPRSSHYDARYGEEVACTDDHVPERCIGGFSGWADVNDWVLLHEERKYLRGIQQCCTGNAARAIYFAWLHTLTPGDGKLRVNLLLNRVSLWADVHSHVPYTGQVDVIIKQPLDLSVRMPQWVHSNDVRVQVNGSDRSVRFDGRYVQVGDVKPGDVATLCFPIDERDEVVNIEKRRYALIRKGNDVVVIDPPGRYCPLYQRDHYRENTTRWRRAQQFCPETTIP